MSAPTPDPAQPDEGDATASAPPSRTAGQPRRRRRTVLVTSRWAASAAVIAAMSVGGGSLSDHDDDADGDAQSGRSSTSMRADSSSTLAPYVSSTDTTPGSPSAEEPTANTPKSV